MPGAIAQGGGHGDGLGVTIAPDEPDSPAREGHHLQLRLDDDAERAFRSDEEVDQVHARPGEVAGRELRDGWHRIGRHRHAHDALRAGVDLEPALWRRRDLPAPEVEHVAAREDHREGRHPVARGAVLERRGASRVGGDGAAHERAVVGGDRRVVQPGVCQRALQGHEGDTRAGPDQALVRRSNRGEGARADHHVAAWGGAAGQRGLRANRQHARGRGQDGRHLRLGVREGHAVREAASHVRGVAQERRDDGRVAFDRRKRRGRRSASANAVGHDGRILRHGIESDPLSPVPVLCD